METRLPRTPRWGKDAKKKRVLRASLNGPGGEESVIPLIRFLRTKRGRLQGEDRKEPNRFNPTASTRGGGKTLLTGEGTENAGRKRKGSQSRPIQNYSGQKTHAGEGARNLNNVLQNQKGGNRVLIEKGKSVTVALLQPTGGPEAGAGGEGDREH